MTLEIVMSHQRVIDVTECAVAVLGCSCEPGSCPSLILLARLGPGRVG